MSRHTERGGGSVPLSSNDTRGRGKNGSKKCHVLFEWSLLRFFKYFLFDYIFIAHENLIYVITPRCNFYDHAIDQSGHKSVANKRLGLKGLELQVHIKISIKENAKILALKAKLLPAFSTTRKRKRDRVNFLYLEDCIQPPGNKTTLGIVVLVGLQKD